MVFDLHFLFDIALLALRIVVAIIFFSSGYSHSSEPAKRSEQVGLSEGATRLLGIVEIAGAISVALGVFIQIGAIMLIVVMAGAIHKKIFVWNTGFYSEEGLGWHYDLLLLCANLVFLATGGQLVLVR